MEAAHALARKICKKHLDDLKRELLLHTSSAKGSIDIASTVDNIALILVLTPLAAAHILEKLLISRVVPKMIPVVVLSTYADTFGKLACIVLTSQTANFFHLKKKLTCQPGKTLVTAGTCCCNLEGTFL